MKGKKDDGLLRAVPGLCWRSDVDGVTVSNPIGRTPVSMNVVPEPTYDHYFRDLGKSPAAPFIDVTIPLEASRGCWWGAKHAAAAGCREPLHAHPAHHAQGGDRVAERAVPAGLRHLQDLSVVEHPRGLPREQDSDYAALIDSIPSLHHLTPPAGPLPIKLERFSPYFDDPALGLQAIGPSLNLVSAYEGVADALDDLVYVFESEPAGISPATSELLREAIANWQATASVSRLVALPAPDDSFVVIDDRPAWPSRELVLRPGLEAEACRALAKGKTLPALASTMRSLGIAVREGQLEELVENWTELGIVFHEDSTYLALATGLRW